VVWRRIGDGGGGEFGPGARREHWQSGLDDVRRTLADPRRLDRPPPELGIITHDVHHEDSAKKSARLINGAKEIYYPGAPHGLTATHQDKVNADLLAVIKS
jgi:hypothetical protein